MNRDDTIEYLRKVAHFLGDWRVDTRNQHNLYLIGENHDVKLFVRSAGYKQSERGKLFFFGCYPNAYNGFRESFTIGISYSRNPASVAKDIKNRLLSNYLPELEKVKKDILQESKQVQKLNLIENMVKNINFDRTHIRKISCSRERVVDAKYINMHLNFKINRNGLTDLCIRELNTDQLIKVSYFLKSLEK